MSGLRKLPAGFRAAGVSCGIKKRGRKDIALLVSDVPCIAAGFFTQNKFAAAPVEICRNHLEKARPRAIVVNSGCANACTGKKGIKDAREMAHLAAEAVGCRTTEVLVASTGVIGEYLPMDKIARGIKKAAMALKTPGWDDAAEAIMTTDTVPKIASLDLEIPGGSITFLGIAKGSGMIHPQLATMLAFIVTDADISTGAFKRAARRAVAHSFNCVTVDGDTSTNDTVIFLANGMAKNKRITTRTKDYEIFKTALVECCQQLARAIARDGEGATKLVEVCVTGARSEKDAKKVANAVATSNLVKTAIFGRDANWGRIVCAIGNSGAAFDPQKVTVQIGSEVIFALGAPQLKSEKEVNRILVHPEIPIHINLNNGNKNATMWTCDLTYDYVEINANYRT